MLCGEDVTKMFYTDKNTCNIVTRPPWFNLLFTFTLDILPFNKSNNTIEKSMQLLPALKTKYRKFSNVKKSNPDCKKYRAWEVFWGLYL